MARNLIWRIVRLVSACTANQILQDVTVIIDGWGLEMAHNEGQRTKSQISGQVRHIILPRKDYYGYQVIISRVCVASV